MRSDELATHDSRLTTHDSALEGLESLVDKNLLLLLDPARQRTDEPRFGCLETIREFGQEQLAASGDDADARDRHAAWCVEVAEEAEPHLIGPDQPRWLSQIEDEQENMRVALAWVVARGDAELGLRLVTALWRFWYIRGYQRQGRQWLERVLALPDIERASPRRRAALNFRANFALDMSDFATAAACYQQCLAIRRESGDQQGIADTLNNLGILAAARGDFAGERARIEEAVAIYRTVDDPDRLLMALCNLGGAVHSTGDHALARSILAETIAIQRPRGDALGEAHSHGHLGEIAAAQGDDETARQEFARALTTIRELGDMRGIGIMNSNLGRIDAADDPARAAAHHAEALAMRWDIGDRRGVAEDLEGLGNAAVARGRPERAARLLAAAAALRETIDAPRPARHAPVWDQTVAATRAALGAGFDAVWSAGATMPLEQAIADGVAEATDEINEPAPRATPDDAPAPMTMTPQAERLTPREREVLRLLAEGCTDREVADRLFISHRTAMQHVANILGKLEVTSRTAAAAFALRHGLA